MTFDDFKATIQRIIEAGNNYRVGLCGTGDPSVHPEMCDFVTYAYEQGVSVEITTNGQLVTRDKAEKLLAAGLRKITFSVTGTDDVYEDIYNLNFEKTRQNILDFRDLAGDSCEIFINLVNYSEYSDKVNIKKLKQYWRNLGFENFEVMKITNRGGAAGWVEVEGQLNSKERVYELMGEYDIKGVCPIAFDTAIIGWDGNYYLCCHDWQHDVPCGHVQTHSVADAMQYKLNRFLNDIPEICPQCNLYPPNYLQRSYTHLRVEYTEEGAFNKYKDIETQIIKQLT